MKKWLLYIYLFWGSLGLLNGQTQDSSDWDFQFPLKIKPSVSGSFGEIRTGHFHSGVDLSTHGKTGIPVYAVDDGFIVRVSVSPIGFGNAIYIQHPSGYTTVYGHLQQFNDRLDSLVTSLQYQQQTFAIQHYFDASEFPVRRGDLIAWSGNSGSSGGPHLHFEIRQTADERPIDPLAFSTPVKDDVRPQIKGIQLYPLIPGGTINGQVTPQYFPAVFYNGRFHLRSNPVIRTSGTIGVGIEVIDYYSGSWRKCGIHRITLQEGSQLAFQFTMTGFLYSQTRYLNSHIDYAEKMTSGRVIQKSFVDPYNHLDLYQTNAQRGQVDVKPGSSKELSYEVKDISGNVSQLSFKVHGTVLSSPAAGIKLITPSMIKAGEPYLFEREGYSVAFKAESFYTDVPADFDLLPYKASLLGKALKVLDKTVPVHSFFEVKMPLNSSLDKRGLTGALILESGKMVAAGGEIQGTNFVIHTREGGLYTLTRDSLPPSVRLVSPPSGMNYRGRQSIVVKVDDDFSGVDEYEGLINGEWVLFEYDAKSRRLVCPLRKVSFLKRGENRLELRIKDKVGNKKQWAAVFKY